MNNLFSQLKIALRNLRTNGVYSVINVGGLAVSLAVCIMIMLWVQDERGFDRFHKQGENIFIANTCFASNAGNRYWNLSVPALASAARNEIPEVENTCRIYSFGMVSMLKNTEGDQKRVVDGFSCSVVDSAFFSMFDFPVLKGDVRRMLTQNQSVVLSERIAVRLFGDENPVGKTLTDNNNVSYQVSGVMADMPLNSSFRFDVLLPFATIGPLMEQLQPGALASWEWFDFKTWFLLRPNTDPEIVAKKLTEIQQRNSPGINASYGLQSIETLNFRNADGTVNGKAQTCRLFSIVAFVLILIACINYVNISTATASRRNKEIFVRNILGAKKTDLFFRFFNESVRLFFLALMAATVLLYLIFPAYNQIIGKHLTFQLFSADTMMIYGATFLAVVFCAGIYPAVSLALQKPLRAIHGTSGGNALLRKGLVVVQFVAAVVLISTTVTTGRQLKFIREKNLGYEKENLFYMPLPSGMSRHYDAMKSELLQNSAVHGVTATSQALTGVTSTYGFDFEGNNDKNLSIIVLNADKDFIPVMQMSLVAGRGFDGTPADNVSFILNETAIKNMDISDPIGKQVLIQGKEGTVIGVVRDFNFRNLHSSIKPLAVRCTDHRTGIYVKTTGADASRAITAAETVWKKYNADAPFSYRFTDDEFDALYKADLRSSVLFQCFAVIAALISCLGLFGLVTYTAEARIKEIGIRKVLGASVSEIVRMLSKDFLVLVGIAMLIAFPLAYWLLDNMLQDYAYKINLSWHLFAFAGLITVTLTILTVGFKAFKAATADPVKSIKTE